MKSITYTLLADGSSDEVLIPIINWAINQYSPNLRFSPQFAKNLGKVGLALSQRIPAALKAFPCDILFIHRDAELESIETRKSEIRLAIDSLTQRYIPIIPIKMTEAWLLSNEIAIRSAAGNKSGVVKLRIPPKKKWETESNPKKILFDALMLASEKNGRALKKICPDKQRSRITELTSDFSDLRGLSSFDDFEKSLKTQLEAYKNYALD